MTVILLCVSCAGPGDPGRAPDPSNYGRVDDELSRRISAEPANPNLLSLRAQARYKLGQFAPGADDCARALALGASGGLREAVLFTQGRCFAGLARHREAVSLYTEAAELATEPSIKAECLVFRAMSRWSLGEDEPALADAELALATDPESGGAACLRILLLNELHPAVDLKSDMDQLINAGKVTGTLASMGLYAAREFGKSEAAASSAIALTPIDGWAWFRRARARQSLGRFDEALADFGRACFLLPGRWAEQVEYAAALDRARRFADALAAIDAAIAIRPGEVEAISTRGAILMDLGDEPGSEAELRRAIQADPEFWPAHVNLGNLFEHRHDDARAVEHWSRALSLHPASLPVLFSRATAYARMGKPEWTVTDCAAISRLNDRQPEVYALAGTAYVTLGEREYAAWCFARALDLDPAHDGAAAGAAALKDVHPRAPSWNGPATPRRRFR